MNRSRRASANNYGFTLIEILISISLLSLLMIATGSTIKTISQTQTKVNYQVNQLDSTKVTIDFLRSIFGQISSISPKGTQNFKKGVFFIGDSKNIQWLGNMPARIGVGGLTYFRISLVNNSAGSSDLVLQYTEFKNEVPPSWDGIAYYSLIKSINKFDINYLHQTSSSEEWIRSWPSSKEEKHLENSEVPLVISFEIENEEYGALPLIYVKLNKSIVNLPSNNGFTIGGSRS